MLNLTAGAPRRANDDARASRLAAANDLVRRTLAQHGLMAPDANAPPDTGFSVLSSGLPKFTSPFGQTARPASPLPEGASFDAHSFTCAQGSRAYRVYVPASATEAATGLVVMLHGCTQDPEDFAAGTGMNALAETHGFVVLYPQQSRGENAQSCWNWFRWGDQRRDMGEPAILAGMTRKVAAEHGICADRTFAAGLSAGAAMAVIMGQTYSDVFAAVGAHSGLAYGSATDVMTAFAAMGGQGDVRVTAGKGVPTIVFHGTADTTVHPSNGRRIVADAVAGGPRQTIETEAKGETAGRRFTREISRDVDGRTYLESWTVEGLGHAWSGGQSGGSYTDIQGPDASAEMIRFFYETLSKETSQ
jgi:poly(hydroxyalkanoate) depolymerase family esterase